MRDTEFGEQARAFLQAHIDEHGFLSWLGVEVEAIEPGRLVMRIPYDERLTNPVSAVGQTIHGGVAATLIDTAGGLAVRTGLDDPYSTGVATIDLNVSYLRPATDDLVATAETVRIGRTVGVAEVDVTSHTSYEGEPDGADPEDPDAVDVAVGRGSYRVFSE